MKWVKIKDALPHRNEKVIVFVSSIDNCFIVDAKNVGNVNGVKYWSYIEHPENQVYKPNRCEQWEVLKETITDMVNSDKKRFSKDNVCVMTLNLVLDMMKGLQ